LTPLSAKLILNGSSFKVFTDAWRPNQAVSCALIALTIGKKLNALSVIFPYRLEGVWVFDDAATGLVREPFISGADKILDVLTERIPDAANGCKIIFSTWPFPGYTARFVWIRDEYGGDWYRWPERYSPLVHADRQMG
jgi:hypothetical protein